MKVSLAILLSLLGPLGLGAAVPSDETASSVLQDLNNEALDALKEAETQKVKRSTCQKCSVSQAAVRRDW